MSTRGSRALLAAAKYTGACSTPAVTTEATLTPEASKSKKSKGSGLNLTNTNTLPISPALQSFVGCREISPDEACKKLWAYIDSHNLQMNESEELILDSMLQELFGGRDKMKAEDLAMLFCAHFVKK